LVPLGAADVLEADDQFLGGGLAVCTAPGCPLPPPAAVLFKPRRPVVDAGDGLALDQRKAALLVVVLAVVLGGVGGGEAEVDRAAVFQLEAVVGEVLAALGVVLILVGPVQHHLFTRVGDGVGVALVAALADEVAVVVVAGEEGQQVREHGVFVLEVASACLLQPGAQFLDLGHVIGVDAQSLCALLGLLQIRLQLLGISCIAYGQRCLNLLCQPVL
jgi:hypothetical protein